MSIFKLGVMVDEKPVSPKVIRERKRKQYVSATISDDLKAIMLNKYIPIVPKSIGLNRSNRIYKIGDWKTVYFRCVKDTELYRNIYTIIKPRLIVRGLLKENNGKKEFYVEEVIYPGNDVVTLKTVRDERCPLKV